jgi:hypothetical protein
VHVTHALPLVESSMAEQEEKKVLLYCSFCGQSQQRVRKLVAGQTANICDECIRLCVQIIAEGQIHPLLAEILTPYRAFTFPEGQSPSLFEILAGQRIVGAVTLEETLAPFTGVVGSAWFPEQDKIQIIPGDLILEQRVESFDFTNGDTTWYMQLVGGRRLACILTFSNRSSYTQFRPN